MEHNMLARARLVLSVSLGAGLFLNARLTHRAFAEGLNEPAHRALRSQAMAELALAWRSPGCRLQWRSTVERSLEP